MLLGIARARAVQQRMMHSLLANMKWNCALAYLDDIAICRKTFEERLSGLKFPFKKCEAAILQSMPAKFIVCKSKTACLGFILFCRGR